MIVCETRFALRAGAMRLHQSCVFLPPANEAYAYDVDGNQTLVTTGTGAWQVEYNGENRPVRWTRPADGMVLEMAYDSRGRRVRFNADTFVYDGYLNVGTTIWDSTERIATRPLVQRKDAMPCYYFHDGNKNVSDMANKKIRGSVPSRWLGGSVVRWLGSCANAQPETRTSRPENEGLVPKAPILKYRIILGGQANIMKIARAVAGSVPKFLGLGQTLAI